MTNEKNATPLDKQVALQNIHRDFKGTDCNMQCARLLEALHRFPVTSYEAMRHPDVYHVPARVLQLRKRGHRIMTHWQTVITEVGEKHRVGLYALESEAPHA
jgi:Helix-turn-helix domain